MREGPAALSKKNKKGGLYGHKTQKAERPGGGGPVGGGGVNRGRSPQKGGTYERGLEGDVGGGSLKSRGVPFG